MIIRLLAVLATLVLATLVGLLIAAPNLMQWQANKFLSQLQCQETNFALTRPSWRQLRIDKLALKDCSALSVASLPVPSIFIQEIKLDFDLGRLITDQKFLSLAVNGIRTELDLSNPQRNQTAAFDFAAIALILDGNALKQLPMDEANLSIDSLVIKLANNPLDELANITLGGTLLAGPDRVQAKLLIQGSPFGNVNAAIELIHSISNKATPAKLSFSLQDQRGTLTQPHTQEQLPSQQPTLQALGRSSQHSQPQTAYQKRLYQMHADWILDADKQSIQINATDELQLKTIYDYLARVQSPYIQQLLNKIPFALIQGNLQNRWQISLKNLEQGLNLSNFPEGLAEQLIIKQEANLSLDMVMNKVNSELPLERISGEISAILDWLPSKIQWQLKPSTQLDITLSPEQLSHPLLNSQWHVESEKLTGILAWQTSSLLPSPPSSLTTSERLAFSAGQLVLRSQQQQLSLSNLRLDSEGIRTDFSGEIKWPQYNLETLALSDLLSSHKGSIVLSSQAVSLTLDPASWLSISSLQLHDLTVKRLNLAIAGPFNIRGAIHPDIPENKTNEKTIRWQIDPLLASLSGRKLNYKNTHKEGFYAGEISGQFRINEPSLTLDNTGSNNLLQDITGSTSIVLHAPRWRDNALNSFRFDSPFELQYPQLLLTPTLQFGRPKPTGTGDTEYEKANNTSPLKLTARANINLQNRRIDARWQTPKTSITTVMSLLPTSLSKSIPALTSLRIKQGELVAQGTYKQRPLNQSTSWGVDADVEITDVEASYSPSRYGPSSNNSTDPKSWSLRNARSILQLNLSDTLPINGHGALWVEQLSGAIDVNNINLSFSLDPDSTDQLMIHQSRFEMFDGHIEFSPFAFQINRLEGSTLIKLSDVDLSKLLALQPQADIQGHGRLEGSLPIHFQGTNIRVTNGRVQAQPPGGSLAYQATPNAEAMAASNPGLAMALTLLSDFRYHTLNLDVNYQPDGKLILDTALKGHNPLWQSGQPVDFNIRIEQNLRTLLQALYFSDTLSERLETQLQQGQN